MPVPPSLSWPLVTPVPQGMLEEKGKIPSVFLIFLDYALLKTPSFSPPPSPSVLHYAAAPSPAVLQHSWLFTMNRNTLCSPCPALQDGCAFWECNAGHFWLNSSAWGWQSWQGISRNREIFQPLLSLLEHKGLSNMQTRISDADWEGRLKAVGVLAWLFFRRWNVSFKSHFRLIQVLRYEGHQRQYEEAFVFPLSCSNI